MGRGRKPDAPGVQEAKGNPGKRKRKSRAKPRTPKLSSGDRTAILIAGDAPKFLSDPKLKKAAEIWRELEGDLRRLGMLDRLDRHTFAMYCVHMADWISATLDIQKRGSWQKVKNVNGDPMPRLNPSVKVREIAEKHILDIGARFGLDPANRYKLLRDQSLAPLPQGGLFDQPSQASNSADGGAGDGDQAAEATGDGDDAGARSPLGMMSDLAAPPPKGSRPN